MHVLSGDAHCAKGGGNSFVHSPDHIISPLNMRSTVASCLLSLNVRGTECKKLPRFDYKYTDDISIHCPTRYL